MAWVLLLLLSALTVHAHRRWRSLGDPELRRLLAALALALLAQALVLRLAAPRLATGTGATLVVVAAALGIVAWAAVAFLVAYGTRGRDLWARVPLLVMAGMGLLASSPRVAGNFAALASISYRWRERFSTTRLFQLAMAALLLFALTTWISADVDRDELEGWTRALADLAMATSVAARGHLLLGAIALFGAFVRDPSLGIRRVGRRLTLSHLLVAGVPLALTAVLWAMTTLLGVSQERAGVGARALEGEAERLSRSLAGALESAAPREALVALARARSNEWPGLRIWWREGWRLERLAGEALEMEGAVATWADSIAALPARGVVVLGDSAFIGAAAQRRGPSPAGAVALVSLRPILRGQPARIAGGPLIVVGVSPERDQEGGSPRREDSLAAIARDSITAERMRRVTRRLGIPDTAVRADRARPGFHVSAGGDTLATAPGGLLQGLTWVEGVRYGPSGWQRVRFPLASQASAAEVLAGFYRRAQESELGLVPVILLALIAALFLLIAFWDVTIVTNLGRSITSALGALRTAAARLEAGDLAHRIELKGDDEVWKVAEAFNTAAAGLERARDREQERQRIESELQVARRIQSRLLPAAPPDVPGLEIAGRYDPAREVGGDYFDHLPAGAGRVLLVIADVSGKSVPAALIMSAFRAALHAQSLNQATPGDLAERLNSFLHESLDPGKFVTAFLGLLDGRDGRLTYVNAGHNPPALVRRDGSYELLEKGGALLGILPGSRYEQGEASLAPGELVALYTDGVTEAADARAQHWGEERLIATLRAGLDRPCAEIAATIAGAVRAFEGERGATDDVTLLLARRRR